MTGPTRLHRREARATTGLEVTAWRDESAFAAARRHSSWVRSLKIVLPALIVVGGGAFAAATFLREGVTFPTGFGDITVKSDSLVMEKPHVSGFQNDGEAYEVRADRAVQDIANPKVVTLEGIAARIGLEGDDAAEVGAGRGVYDTTGTRIQLSDGITVTTRSGLEARLEAADVDLDAGRLQSSDPVEVRSADGMIRGNEVEISDGGKRIVFRGGVSMTMSPTRGEAADAPLAFQAESGD